MKRILSRLAMAAVAAIVLRSCVIETYRVTGEAMLPNIAPGDVVIASKLSYGWRVPGSGALLWQWSEIKPGDLVVLANVGDPPMTLIRRVVAVEGQRVRTKKGSFQVEYELGSEDWTSIECEEVHAHNDNRYCYERLGDQRYLVKRPIFNSSNPNFHYSAFSVPEDLIFVLADDRNLGPDSRHFYAFPAQSVVGKVLWIWDPNKAENNAAEDNFLADKLRKRGYFSRVK